MDRTMKICLVIVSICILALGGVLLFETQPTGLFGLQDSEIKIGSITTLTGEMANYGIGIKNAEELAVKEINAKGGINGNKLKLIFENSPCNPEMAITSVNKLIQIDKIDLLAGPVCSSELLAIAPIVESSKLTVISSTATSPNVTNAGEHIFRTAASDNLRAELFAEYIYKDAEVKEMGLLYPSDDASNAYVTFFREKFLSLGGIILAEETYAKGASDMRTQLTKLKEKKITAIMMPNWPNEAGNILVQAKELDMNVKFFEGFEIMTDPQVKNIAGDLINEITYIQSAEADNTVSETFKENYKKEYGVEAPYYAAESYDLIYLYAKVLKTTGLKDVSEELYTIKDFEGASGVITFNSNGDVLKPFEIKEIQNGQHVLVKVV